MRSRSLGPRVAQTDGQFPPSLKARRLTRLNTARRRRRRRQPSRRRGLHLESLERREMLAVSVDDFHLLEDTGLSQTDLMTSNPTVTGTVNGDFAGGHVQLEFDHNSDAYSEGYVTVYAPGGAFTYDPRWYDYSVAMHTGSFTLNYRAVEYDSMASVVSTSEWQSFTFTIGRPEISVVQQLLRNRSEEPQGQKLLIAPVGRRPAVLFSEFDLVAAAAGLQNYRSLGYKPESARKILGNLLGCLAAD